MLGTRPPRVALFDTTYPSTLAMLQSLARAGVSVYVYQNEDYSPLRYSRYAKHVGECPPLDDYDQFPAWLRQQLETGAFDVVAPTSDVLCYHIAQALEYIAEPYRSRLPTQDAFLDVLFKDRLALACARHSIPTPRTRAPINLEQALLDADEIGYPLILKPRSHICNPHERGCRVDNPEELRANFDGYSIPESQRALILEHPELIWPLLQQYVDHRNPQLSCSGVLATNGETVAASATVKVDQSPSATGVGTAFYSHDDAALIQECTHAVSQILGRGIFEIEVLSEGDGPNMVIDINARAFGQITFDIARGNDLPALWHDSLNGQAPPMSQPRQAVVCLDPGPFLLANLTRIITGPNRWRRLVRAWRLILRTRNLRGWSWRDPVASLLMCLWPLRHPSTFIRSHIRERSDADLPY